MTVVSWYRSAKLGAFALCVGLLATTSALAQKPDLITVRWGGTPSIELETPLHVAINKKFFEEEGIKVGDPLMGPGTRIREALAAGEIDFADLGTLTYLVGRGKGLPQTVVFEYFTKEIFSLFVPTRLKNEIKSVADLKGRKVLVNALGAASHVAGLAMIRKAGLKDSDVAFLGVGAGGDPATWISQVESGNFDAGVTWEPTSSYLISRQAAFPLVDIRDSATHEKWIGKNASSMILVVSNEMIAKRPEVIQRVVRALKKATEFIQKSSASEVAAAAAGGFKMDPVVLTSILEPIKGNFSPDGSISRSGMALEVDLALGGGILTKKLTFDEMVDPKFAGAKD